MTAGRDIGGRGGQAPPPEHIDQPGSTRDQRGYGFLLGGILERHRAGPGKRGPGDPG